MQEQILLDFHLLSLGFQLELVLRRLPLQDYEGEYLWPSLQQFRQRHLPTYLDIARVKRMALYLSHHNYLENLQYLFRYQRAENLPVYPCELLYIALLLDCLHPLTQNYPVRPIAEATWRKVEPSLQGHHKLHYRRGDGTFP